MVLPQLRRVRWAVRATLVLGVAASVVANVLHALNNPISQTIAAWPPLALLLTVELISRVPVHHRALTAVRVIATAVIAGIAAWVSYWHMAGVAARYGETGASPYLLPLSVDGLIVVASICLVELSGRIATLEPRPADLPMPASAPDAQPALTARIAPAASVTPAEVPAAARPAEVPAAVRPAEVPAAVRPTVVRAEVGSEPTGIPGLIPTPATASGNSSAVGAFAGTGAPAASPLRRSTAAALAEVAAALPRGNTPEDNAFTPALTRQTPARPAPAHQTPAHQTPARQAPARPTSAVGPGRTAPTAGRAKVSAARSTAGSASGTATARVPATRSGKHDASTPTAKSRRAPAETVALAAQIKAARPRITETELAAELGISLSRWRTVRREAAQTDEQALAA